MHPMELPRASVPKSCMPCSSSGVRQALLRTAAAQTVHSMPSHRKSRIGSASRILLHDISMLFGYLNCVNLFSIASTLVSDCGAVRPAVAFWAQLSFSSYLNKWLVSYVLFKSAECDEPRRLLF